MLPFPRAHYYIAAFFVVTLAAFSPSYFLKLPSAPLAHHLHGITATLWIVLLCTQNWSIHRGRRALHIWSGRASLLLVPFFTAGGLLVTQVTILRPSPFNALFGTALAFTDIVATAAFLLLFGLALRHRRQPALHARFMLSTIVLLAPPSLSRVFANYIPGFSIRSAEELPKFGMCVDASFAVTSLFIAVLILRDLRSGKPIAPFGIALLSAVGMWVGYKVFGYTEFWEAAAPVIASPPAAVVVLAGLAAGAAAGWLGWHFPAGIGRQRRLSPKEAAA